MPFSSVVTPLVLGGRVLVDGALLNPLPIIPTISAHADLVVAVNLSGEDYRRQRIPDAAFAGSVDDDTDEWMDTIRDKASRWFDWDALKSLGPKKIGGDSPEEKYIERGAEKKSTISTVRKSCRKSTRPLIGTNSWNWQV